MPPSRKLGPKSSLKVSKSKQGSTNDVSEEEKRRKFLEDSESSDPDDPDPVSDRVHEDSESDRDPDDPDPVSDQDSIFDFSEEEEAAAKAKKKSESSDFSDEPKSSSPKKSPKHSKSVKKKRSKDKEKDFLETSSDEESLTSLKPSKKSDSKKEDGNDKRSSESVANKKLKADAEDELPVTFNQYYRHKCKLAALKSAKTITGQDVCKPGRPAELSLDKLKLHYVVHYLYRGAWDHIVPEEEPSSEGRVECYICNICHKRFKNHLEKKEYPGRGSVLCHLATDHGLLLDVMKDEKEVDLSHDIKILAYNDKQFRDAYENGPDTSKMKIQDLISVKESMLWRLQQQKKKSDKKAEEAEKWKSDARNLFSEVSSKPLNPTASAEPPKPASIGLNAANKPSLLECPHCDEMSGNDDAPNLRLHIFHHYKEHWNERISKLAKGEKSFFCDRCPRKKKITGATSEGTRTAAVCHFAIQHYELRGVLEKDPKITPQFIKDLYWDHDHPSSASSSYYQSQAKQIKAQSPAKKGRTPTKRKPVVGSDEDSDSDNNCESSEVSSIEMSLSDDFDSDPNDDASSVEMTIKKPTVTAGKTSKPGPLQKSKSSKNGGVKDKSKIMPGEPNPNYVLKKTKTALTLDSEDDSASDHEWSTSKKKNNFGMSGKKKRKLFNPKEDYDQVPKGRILPARKAAQQKILSFLEEEENDDD